MSRAAVLPIVAAVLVLVGLWQTVGVVRSAFRVAHDGARTSRTDRELLPAHVVGIADTSIFPRLASLMPPRSTYVVSTSPDARASELGGGYVGSFLNYWLLPRRPVSFTIPHAFTVFFGSLPKLNGAFKVTQVSTGVELVQNR